MIKTLNIISIFNSTVSIYCRWPGIVTFVVLNFVGCIFLQCIQIVVRLLYPSNSVVLELYSIYISSLKIIVKKQLLG